MLGFYSQVYGVKMHEATNPDFRVYSTFTDFFTRTLKEGARPVSLPMDKTSLCSPCDGTVLTVGTVGSQDSTIDCVKGHSYRLDEFMLGVIGNESDTTNDAYRHRSNNTGVQSLL